MDNIKNIINKFPAASRAVTAKQPVKQAACLNTWKDSNVVITISEYLKGVDGMELVMSDGCLALRFTPGLKPENKQRWSQALHALAMLDEARNDLYQLIKNKKLKLKRMTF